MPKQHPNGCGTVVKCTDLGQKWGYSCARVNAKVPVDMRLGTLKLTKMDQLSTNLSHTLREKRTID